MEKRLAKEDAKIVEEYREAVAAICEGPYPLHDPAHITHLKPPYHSAYRYVIGGGRRRRVIKYDVDPEDRAVDNFDFNPRGAAYS